MVRVSRPASLGFLPMASQALAATIPSPTPGPMAPSPIARPAPINPAAFTISAPSIAIFTSLLIIEDFLLKIDYLMNSINFMFQTITMLERHAAHTPRKRVRCASDFHKFSIFNLF
jgi:hypothetical protein